ncbi:MAG: 4-(cytidine 5'-diphospho)-2-C-methyl-D-erythritol kinase [Eubacteriales bacterium]
MWLTSNKCIEPAHAKINLYLDVTARRPDGYHELATVMQQLALHDTLTLTLSPARAPAVRLCTTGNYPVPGAPEENLAYRAAMHFMAATGISLQVEAVIDKQIPLQAGLGGGSSDGAAMLRALNLACGTPLDPPALHRLAASLGSDVPFFLGESTAFCTGRGEILRPVQSAVRLPLLLVGGQESSSTGEAYRALDRHFGEYGRRSKNGRRPEDCRLPRMLAGLQTGDVLAVARALYNIFEQTVYESCPASLRLKEKLLLQGALGACLCGSGAWVFAVFDSDEAAAAARAAIPARSIATATRADDTAPPGLPGAHV